MPDNANKDTLLAAERALQAAQLASDVTALDNLLDDEVLYVGPDGSLITKEDDLSALRSGQQSLSRIDEVELRTRVTGSTGLTWSLLDLEGSVGGQSVAARIRYTRTWTYTVDTGWRVVAAHATVMGPTSV